jgi:protease-4
MKHISLLVAAVALTGTFFWASACGAPAGQGTQPSPAAKIETMPSSMPSQPAPRPKVTASASASKSAKHSDGPTIAYIRLSGEVHEAPPNLALFHEDTGGTLQEWLKRLAAARKDKTIAAVALDVDGPGLSWAQAQELADGVARLNAVKPVYAFLNSPCAADHLVASACREIAMDPADTLTVLGVGVEMLYYRGTLDLLGVAPQFVQVGAFKGASEPYAQTQPSKEVQQQYGWILDDLYDQLLTQLTQHRKLTRAQAKEVVDTGILSGPEAKKAHLVDCLVEKADWREAVEDHVAPPKKPVYWEEDYGLKDDKGTDWSSPLSILGALLKAKRHEEITSPTIAVVHAEGVITLDGDGDDILDGPGVSARRLAEIFADLETDDRVKAVIFRIDSPGGSALASEQIYQAVRRCREVKPVIASISSMGASGGYYIATGATTILADPASLIGSIGVVSGKMAYSGLMEKVGVSRFEITRGANAGMEMSRPWTDREEALIRKHAQLTYEMFLQRVKESRGKKVPKVEEVAAGRVFTARQAKENGLVDEIGGLREAVLKAQQLAHVTEAHFITLPRPRTLMDLLAGGGPEVAIRRLMSGAADPTKLAILKLAGPHEKAALSYLFRMKSLLGREKVLAVVPGYMNIRW